MNQFVFQSVPAQMFVQHLFLVVVCLSGCLARNNVQLFNNISVPLHYNVELTIDVAAKKFFISESIAISVLQTTTEIQINSNRLHHPSLEVRIVGEDGRVFVPEEVLNEYDQYSEVMNLRFSEDIPGGFNYTLYLAEIEDDFGRGLIEVPLAGTDKYLLSTGFNATNLRSVFPCYDQPEFRTTFDIVIYHPEGYNLVIGSDEVITTGPIAEKDNFIRREVKFRNPLPTYSIGFMLTDMDVFSSSVSRVRVYHTNVAMTNSLHNWYHKLLVGVEEELKMSLEFAKLDVIYVPSLPTWTLTKWGLITVGMEMFPVENSVVHSVELKDIQKEIARSVYEMFFTQLVSPEWWIYQWIPLGLARFYSGVSKHLPFDAEEEFLMDSVQMVIRTHNENTETSMEYDYYESSRINRPDLFTIDQRAGVLMRTIANVIGRENFFAAVLELLSTKKYSTITRDDFTDLLDKYTGETVSLPENTNWSEMVKRHAIALPIGEVLQVYRYSDNSSVELFRGPTERVALPIDYITETSPMASGPKFWIPGDSPNFLTLENIADPWIVFNPNYFAAFQVSYSDPFCREFARQLRLNHTVFPSHIRRQLIDDSGADMVSGLTNHLFIIQYLKNETDTATWKTARIRFEKLFGYMQNYAKMELFNYFYNNLAGEEYLRYRFGGEWKDFEKTMEVAKIACYSNHPECVKDVEDYYNTAMENGGLTGSRDFQLFIYCTMAGKSLEQEILADHVLQLWIADRREYSMSRTALKGLACTTNTTIINDYLDMATTDRLETEYGVNLTQSERFFIIHTFMRGSYVSVVTSLEYILNSYMPIEEQLDAMQDLFVGFRNYVYAQRIMDLLVAIQAIEGISDAVKLAAFTEELHGSSNMFNADMTKRFFEFFLLENAEYEGGNGGNARKDTGVVLLLTVVLFVKILLV